MKEEQNLLSKGEVLFYSAFRKKCPSCKKKMDVKFVPRMVPFRDYVKLYKPSDAWLKERMVSGKTSQDDVCVSEYVFRCNHCGTAWPVGELIAKKKKG